MDCVVGAGTKIGEKCSIKKSVIGRHCHIEDKVKIINSVIMNHVTISAGYEHLFLLLLRPSVVTRSFVFHRCTVNGSIICNNVHMKPGCTIKDSQIGVAYHVQEKGTVHTKTPCPSSSHTNFLPPPTNQIQPKSKTKLYASRQTLVGWTFNKERKAERSIE